MRFKRPRLTRSRIIAGSLVTALVAALLTWAAWPERKLHTTQDQRITVRTGPDDATEVTLDARLYLPVGASRSAPVPAILLAHGFGGTKESVRADAQDFADLGYAVLTWSAQGFGASGGQIHLNSPDWEVKDARRLLDWLAARPDIATDAPGDPKVALVGGSYGGGLALLTAGYDQRVDAIVPMITWNDLARSFLPEATGRGPADGVFKKQWAGLFFGAGGRAAGGPSLSGLIGGGTPDGAAGGPPGTGPEGGAAPAGTAPGTAPSAAGSPAASTPAGAPGASAVPGGPAGQRPGGRPAVDPACGRFAADVCAAYLDLATTGKPNQAAVDLLRRSSPATVLDRIKAPTLLIQGAADSLFPLSEADANARGIAAAGTPVRLAWFTGGHDGGSGPQTDRDRLRFLTAQWLEHHVRGEGAAPSNSFTYSRVSGFDANDRGMISTGYSVKDYPGLAGASTRDVRVTGRPQQVANPPGGNPAALSSLPIAGALSSFVNGAVLEIPGQHGDFYSEPLTEAVDVVGAPKVEVRAASPTGEAVLFVKLYDVDPRGSNTLPNGLVAPIRLTGLPTDISAARPVTVTLPTIVHRFEEGHRLRVTLATSDQAYLTPTQPQVYTVAVDSTVLLPAVAGAPIASPTVVYRYVLAGLVAAILLGIGAAVLVARRRHRNRDRSVVAEHADTPLVVTGLRKEYGSGFVAVAKVDFTVQRNTVVGLLGPNGAGKTTSLRVLMGLTRPTAGEILIFGHRLVPGAPVLSRVGSLVEGPGFLPHLSGRRNLELYWRSTGRPLADARLDEALEIAGLGGAIERRVRTYSHGMKQRLAIAQAMLGLPDLLLLDEPTDGLDPPQIAEMRLVLRRYATDGRAVLVSSHLLAEVEQTCTDVVVMHRGEVVASGPVADIVGESPTVLLDVSDVDAAGAVLAKLDGVRSVVADGERGIVVDANGSPRSEIVAALVGAGVGVDRVVPRRRLEDAFLSLVGGDTKASGER